MITYKETVNWIFEKLPMYQRIGPPAYKADLNNTIKLMEITGNPHEKIRTIHIAGTNGKGSVSHLLASVLQEAGYKTGLYTSPHLFDYRERMRINGKKIPEEFVVQFIHKYKNQIEHIQPSFFEITVAMAFCWFNEEKTDICVIETGMGGRLDSTNVICPVLSVITNIGMDHTQFLGNTLEKIAAEKAGIIKQNVPVVIGETNEKTISVFKNFALEKNAPLTQADMQMSFLQKDPSNDYLIGDIFYNGELYLENLLCPLKGEYQKNNILTVTEALRILEKTGIHLNKSHIYSGISKVITNTSLNGRWQKVSEKPLIICDVAHNNEALSIVFEQLLNMKFEKLHIVFGVNNDKNLTDLFNILPPFAVYYFCKAEIPRAMPPEYLCNEARLRGIKHFLYQDVSQAFYAAVENCNQINDIIFVSGSTFVVAEIPLLKNSEYAEK